MGNCLKTQLKESVSNDNLVKIGAFNLDWNLSEPASIAIVGSVEEIVKVSILTPGYQMTVNGSPVSSVDINNYATDIIFPAGQYKVSFENKYSISGLSDTVQYGKQAFMFPLSELKWADLYRLAFIFVDGDVKELVNQTHFTDFIVYNIKGTVTDLATMVNNNQNLHEILIDSAPQFNGNIDDLGTTSLTSIQIKQSGMRGTIEGLVSNFISNGRASGDITLNLDGSNSVLFGEYYYLNCKRLKWDSSTILLAYGSDADIADSSKNVTIYAKGYSASQISTWESQNNTVYVVS